MSVTASAENPPRPPLFRQMRFEDNSRLLSLVGVHDENLTLLEDTLQISAIHRGSSITITGNEYTAVEQAISVLADFYQALADDTSQTQSEDRFCDFLHRRLPLSPRTESTQDGLETPAYVQLYKQDAPTSNQLTRQMLSKHEPSPRQPSLPGIGVGPTSSINGYLSVQTPKLLVKARNQSQHDYLCAIRDATMVFGLGSAGTGKTFLAVAMAVTMLQRAEVDRIVLTRPAREAGEQLGFLPGDIADKLDPYLRPIHDALEEMLPPQIVAQYIKNRQIEIAPLAYMRGRSLKRAVVILDEAQNTTIPQMLMFLTRLGEGSKMIINGDPNQIDLPHGQKSGLIKCAQCLPFDDNIRLVRYHDRDIVRHPLLQRIVASFAEADTNQ